MKSTQTSLTANFRSLHESGCFVLPNPWDIGTAIYLEHLGFKALASTSAGYAFSRSKPDGGIPRDEMLVHIREIVEATSLPVNADFQAGYADEPQDVAANVQLEQVKAMLAALKLLTGASLAASVAGIGVSAGDVRWYVGLKFAWTSGKNLPSWA